MKKIIFCILGLLMSAISANPCYPYADKPIEKNVKESLIRKDWDKVIEEATVWKNEVKSTAVPYFILVYAYYAKGDYQRIAQLFDFIDTQEKKESLLSWAEGFSREYPQNSVAYLLKGDAYVRLKDYGKAIKELDMAQELDPRLFLVYAAKGMFYSFQNSYDPAIKNFSMAIKLEPGSADAYNNRGIAYYAKGDYRKALDDFSQAIKTKPGFTLAYIGRGMVYQCLGKEELAADDFKKAKELDSQGFALASNTTKDPSTGKIMRNFSINLETQPSKIELKVPMIKKPLIGGSLGTVKGIDSRPEGQIRKIEDAGVANEKALDNKPIVSALYFLLYNDQFFFGASRGR